MAATRRCAVIGGAPIKDYARMREALREDDFCVYCDCGLRHRDGLGKAPDLIVGDFDSFAAPPSGVPTITLPREKDDTDTVFAVKEALRRGFDAFLLLGAAGGRLDHTLGNLSILLMLDTLGKTALLADDFSEMEIVSRGEGRIPDTFPYFSLLNISGTAKGVTIRDAKYPLNKAEITCDYAYGVSNEPLPGKTAAVTVDEGRLLLIRDRI